MRLVDGLRLTRSRKASVPSSPEVDAYDPSTVSLAEWGQMYKLETGYDRAVIHNVPTAREIVQAREVGIEALRILVEAPYEERLDKP